MYVVGLFMMFVMTVLGVGGVELGIAFQHGQGMRNAAHVATDYMDEAESQYVAQQTTNITSGIPLVTGGPPLSSGPPLPLCATTAGAAPARGRAISGADNTNCNTYGAWSITTNDVTPVDTTLGAGEETSSNINIGQNEQRAAATITVQISQQDGTLIATKRRTITLRTVPLAPYVAISDSADSHDPFITGTGVIGGTGGTAEGDPAGCVKNSGCGDPTTIATYGQCPTTGAPLPTQNPLWAAWCAKQSGLANAQADGGSYDPAGIATGTWLPVDASTYVSKQWNNGGDAANAGN